MFDNIGAKIKGLAKAGCWIGIVGCIFVGVVLLFTEEEFIPIALGVAAGGSLASWIGSWFLYGFGQLIENSDVIAEQSQRSNEKAHKQEKRTEAAQERRRKEKVRRSKEEMKKMLSNDAVEADIELNFSCPHCGKEVFFTKEEVKVAKPIDCPHCYETILMKDLLG